MDTTEMTDRLKSEVAVRLTALTPYLTTDRAVTTEEATRLLGVVLDGIDVAMQPDDLDPSPWPGGAPVRLIGETTQPPGKVHRAVDTDGEVHTVWVLFPGALAPMPFSPRELERVR